VGPEAVLPVWNYGNTHSAWNYGNTHSALVIEVQAKIQCI